VRYRFQKIQVKEYTSIVIKLQGDVKSINLELNQFRRLLFLHSPVFYLREWQEIVIPLKTCIPRLEEEN
jgi:hypothetical protein